MIEAFVIDLLRANLVAAALVCFVLLVRAPVRRLAGPSVAYGLWLIPPAGVAASLLPERIALVDERFGPDVMPAPDSWAWVWTALAIVWAVGAAFFLLRLYVRHGRAFRELERGRSGPAVIGAIRPRMVLPRNFTELYTPEEQAAVVKHEAAHLRRQDVRVIALCELARCVCWFNPLAHVALKCLREDQELACDADVIARDPSIRRAYAEAMVKSQLQAPLTAIGCGWPVEGASPLVERVALLARAAPSRLAMRSGVAALVVAVGGAGFGGWAAQPVRTIEAVEVELPPPIDVELPPGFKLPQ
jgi:beta-lactamase regulating signal transducer with metallopeptidase domain